MALHDNILFNFIVLQKLGFFVWHFKFMNINNNGMNHLQNISYKSIYTRFSGILLEFITHNTKSIRLNMLRGYVNFLIKLSNVNISLNSPCTWVKGWAWKFVFTLCKLNPKGNLQQDALYFVLRMHCLKLYLTRTI